MTDPIADMFTRIRNASAVKKPKVLLPMSKLKYALAKILEKEGWIKKAAVIAGGLNGRRSRFDELEIELKYRASGQPQIKAIRRVSRPGLKIYVTKEEIPRVLHNFGLAIISTSRGLMTDKEARKQKLGGEVIGEIF